MPLEQNLEFLLRLMLAVGASSILAFFLYWFFVGFLSHRKGLR